MTRVKYLKNRNSPGHENLAQICAKCDKNRCLGPGIYKLNYSFRTKIKVSLAEPPLLSCVLAIFKFLERCYIMK